MSYDENPDKLAELQKRIIAFRDARDWRQFHNPKDLSISIALEAAELMEHFQWRSPEEVKDRIKTHRNDIEEEMADIFNYLLILSKELEVDLIDVTSKKLAKNESKYTVAKSRGSSKKYTEL